MAKENGEVPTKTKLIAAFTSRKFLLSLLGVIITTLGATGVIPLDDDNLWQIITILLGYIGVEGSADLVRAWRTQAQAAESTTIMANKE